MALATLDVELTILGGRNIPTRYYLTSEFKKIRYYVDIRVGNQSDRTSIAHVSKAGSPIWNSKFVYNVCQDWELVLELYCLHDHRPTHRVGSLKVIDILSLQPSHNHELQLYSKRGAECGTISVQLQILMVAGHCPTNPTSCVPKRYSLDRIKKLGVIINVLDNTMVESMSPAWTNLLFSLGSLVKLAKHISQIDPKARSAIMTIAFAFEMAVQQCIRDQRVEGLIETMAVIYYLIMESEPLEKIRSFRVTIERLLDTTSECALFVASYCETKKFTVRAVLNAVSNVDFIPDSFEKTFSMLRMEFVTTSSLHIAIHAVRILEKVEDIAKDVQDINVSVNLPMHGNGWDPHNTCLPGSQTNVINDITNWAISQQPKAPIYLLVGPPGCGKTCIANSIAAMFDHGRRLGASVFLDRNRVEHTNPTKFFSSIARELAAFDEKLKLRISQAISQQPSLSTAVLERQLRGLIIEPFADLTIIGPIIVIIDGLDVWKNRGRILSTLRNARDLPQNLRILITTRHEDDIINELTDIPHCHQRHMTIDEEGLVKDTPSHSYRCLQILQDIRPAIFSDSTVDEVFSDFAAKSRGGYLWISVAIRFLATASDDTARAFLSEISSASEPQNYADTMSALEHAICRVLMVTSPLRLKSKLSVGAAIALGVVGLRSDKTDVVLKTMFERLLEYDDNASCFLSAIWHPASRYVGVSDHNHQCLHVEVQDASNLTSFCMAHVCMDFLDSRLSSDICSRTCQTKNGREIAINPHLREELPTHLRNYIDEADQYAHSFWIDHLADVRDCCDIHSLKSKMRAFSRHFVHLLEFSNKNGWKTNVLEKFHEKLHGSKVYDDDMTTSCRP
ncbi:hypothetical protein AX15_007114 [Amanita polypyramis BW_CC]|nr:hypothetical protein AX15_007114 [Amanita polypyramis BW_CC]